MSRAGRRHGSAMVEVIVVAIIVSLVLTAAFAAFGPYTTRTVAGQRRDELAAATGAIDATLTYLAHAPAGPEAPGAPGGPSCATALAASGQWPAVAVACSALDASDVAPDARRVRLVATAGPVSVTCTVVVAADGTTAFESDEVLL